MVRHSGALNLRAEPNRPHSPAQAWTQRLPSPPRINVPPPLLNAHGLPDLNIAQGSVDFDGNGFSNAAFLKKVTHGHSITLNNMIDWRYEQRHQAQQILPFLFLGPVTAARDSTFLQSSGITMVLAVRNTMSAQARLLGSKAAANLGIQSATVDVAGNQELIAAFPTAIDIINSHLSQMYGEHAPMRGSTATASGSSPGKVLVFCESGNERSAALVTAYVMAMYSMDMIKAIQLVQAQRFAISIDDSTRNYLETYNSMLQAKRDVIKQQSDYRTYVNSNTQNRNSTTRQSGKRSLEETYDEADLDMGGEMGNADRERFEQRDGLAPFQE